MSSNLIESVESSTASLMIQTGKGQTCTYLQAKEAALNKLRLKYGRAGKIWSSVRKEYVDTSLMPKALGAEAKDEEINVLKFLDGLDMSRYSSMYTFLKNGLALGQEWPPSVEAVYDLACRWTVDMPTLKAPSKVYVSILRGQSLALQRYYAPICKVGKGYYAPICKVGCTI